MNFEELIVLIDDAVYRHRQRHLRDIDILVLKESLNQKSYDQIADENNYTGQYLRQDVGPKLWNTLSAALEVKISKKSCARILENFANQYQCSHPVKTTPALEGPLNTTDNTIRPNVNLRMPQSRESSRVDWGDATDSTVFYGREQELTQLQAWICDQSCRLVALTGMGGIGKTTLALKLTERLLPEFDFVMVRSMRNAPKLHDILSQFFDFIGLESESTFANIDEAIQQFIAILKESRCLILFDNIETLLQSNTCVGHFQVGYEAYGMLLQQIADQSHQSCVVLTSRELPQGIDIRAGLTAPVQNLKLSGIQLGDAQSILQHKGIRNIHLPSLKEILAHYGGNPLALKIVASGILELGEGDLKSIIPLIEQGILKFEDIDELLGRQFQRLNDIERQVMYWLALHREPVSLRQLEQDILRFNSLRQLPKAVQALGRRSLLERNTTGIFLQPVVMEYVTQRFLESLLDEIVQGQYVLLQTYALLNAQAKDYIREAQQRFILNPLLASLRDPFETCDGLTDQFLQILSRLRIETPRQASYACGNILNLLRQLNGHLNRLDCSNLSVWQAYLVGVPIQDINFSQADLSRSIFSSVLSTTLSVCFSPNGQFFAMGNADNNIRVWTVKDYKEHRTFQGHSHWVSTVTFCPKSQLLMSGSFDKTIKTWDLETGLCLNTLIGHTGWIWSIVCSADLSVIASCSDDHTIRIWDRQTGECLRVLDGQNAAIWSLAFSPDGQWLASASSNMAVPVKLWDWKTGEGRDLIPATLERRVRSVAFSPDGQWLVTGSMACITEIWDVTTGECLQQFRGHSQPVTCVAFAPPINPQEPRTSRLLATGSQDQTLRLWNLETGQSLHTLKGHPTGLWSLAFHPTQPLLISGSNDSTVKLWNTQTGESVRTIQGYSIGIKAIAISPDQTQFASAGDSTIIHVWDCQTHEKQHHLSGHLSWIWALIFTEDGKSLISGGNDNVVKLWDLSTGEVIRNFIGHRSLIFSLALSPDSAILASASDDHSVRLWDVMTGQCLETLSHGGRVWSVAFSPDGRFMACGNCETLISIWDVETRTLVDTLEEHSSLVWAIAYSPNGNLLASGSDDTTIKIWDMDSRTCRQTLVGHQGSIWAIAFSPDGAQVVTGSNDQTIRFWDVASGELLQTIYGHDSTIWDIKFRGAAEIMSASQAGLVKIWDVATGECTATLRDTRPYEGMNLTDSTGLTDAQKMSLATLGAIV